jgi:DNA-binding MurR/RpiR family transcriptional regulator
MEHSIIKGIVTFHCPHCNEEVFAEMQSTAPTISAVLTEEQVNKAKDEVLSALEEKLTEEQFEDACDAIKDKSFLFGPNDVQTVIDQYLQGLKI